MNFENFNIKTLVKPKHVSDDLLGTSWHQNKELPLARRIVFVQAPFKIRLC